MKKLALALVATSFVAGAATADISTGYYLGAGVGMNTFTAGSSRDGMSHNHAQFNLYTGYGVVNGCTYLGAELGYTFANSKIGDELKRRNVINAAFLVGQKFSPSTMMYLRLGMNSAQYKIADQSKRKISFAPGLGMETAVTKNVRIRLEYVYDLGNKFDDAKFRSQAVTLGVAYKF